MPSVMPPWLPVFASTGRQPCAGHGTISMAKDSGVLDQAAVTLERFVPWRTQRRLVNAARAGRGWVGELVEVDVHERLLKSGGSKCLPPAARGAAPTWPHGPGRARASIMRA